MENILKVYHGGTAFDKNNIKRSYEASNNGYMGYYVTTDKNLAADYGVVHTYILELGKDCKKFHPNYKQIIRLNEISGFYKMWGEIDPYDYESCAELSNNSNIYEAVCDCVNAVGFKFKIIKYMVSLGCNYMTVNDLRTLIVFDGLKEIL